MQVQGHHKPTDRSQIFSDGRKSMDQFLLSPISVRTVKQLKLLRAHIDMTLNEFADISGVSLSTLKQIQTGDRPLLIHQALNIANSVGVDVCSLLTGKVLLEWGGAAPFDEDAYQKWIDNGSAPSREQAINQKKQVANLCQHIAQDTELGPVFETLLTVYLSIIPGGVNPEIQYAGLST